MAKVIKSAKEIADIFKRELKENGYDLNTINIVHQGKPGDWRPVFGASNLAPEFTTLSDQIRDMLRNTYELKD